MSPPVSGGGENAACAPQHHTPLIFFPRKENGRCDRPKERRLHCKRAVRRAATLADCTAHSAALPRLVLLYDLPLLLLSAVAQPLAALLPYGCGTPLAGAALESERKCSVITCYRWHNIAASAAKPPRQAVCRPMRRHTRLTIVRRGCKTVTKRTDSWRSHVHRT